MLADLWAVGGFVLVASLLVFGVWKLDMRLLAAGAALASIVWLGIAFTNAVEEARAELVTLHLRTVDAISGEPIAGAVVQSIEKLHTGAAVNCRLPTRTAAGSNESAPLVAVALLVEFRVSGSLLEQYDDPVAHAEVVNHGLEITLPGYRPWHGTLREVLPEDWPIAAAESPIVIEVQSE